jgi:hypothetical protein
MEDLQRSLDCEAIHVFGTEAIHVFGTNYEANFFNLRCLQQLPGEASTYTSMDTGSADHLKTLTLKGRVTLKVGTPVILLKNLSDLLVNGLRGVVNWGHAT